MPRRVRVEEIGFYHIINRGVERRNIFLVGDDRDHFIKIIDESAVTSDYAVYSSKNNQSTCECRFYKKRKVFLKILDVFLCDCIH